MDDVIRRFLEALDQALRAVASSGQRLDLYHIGRSSLVLHYELPLPTRDFDIVQMHKPLEEKAVALFGKGSANAEELGLYLELVPQGLPPMPHGFTKRCSPVEGAWQVIRLWRPEPNDLAATKLTSFRGRDREDLKFLCDAGLVTPEGLRNALELAFIWSMEKDGDPLRERAFANLDKVIAYLEGRADAP